jgi:hypothetical protein
LSTFDNLEKPPDTAASEACQNSGAEASPIRQRIGKPHMKGGFARESHLANLSTPVKMIKSIA